MNTTIHKIKGYPNDAFKLWDALAKHFKEWAWLIRKDPCSSWVFIECCPSSHDNRLRKEPSKIELDEIHAFKDKFLNKG